MRYSLENKGVSIFIGHFMINWKDKESGETGVKKKERKMNSVFHLVEWFKPHRNWRTSHRSQQASLRDHHILSEHRSTVINVTGWIYLSQRLKQDYVHVSLARRETANIVLMSTCWFIRTKIIRRNSRICEQITILTMTSTAGQTAHAHLAHLVPGTQYQ